MAIDPSAIDTRSAFEGRLEQLLDRLTRAPLVPGAPGPVLYPGQPEAEREKKQAQEGIAIDREHRDSLVELGRRYGVAFPPARPLR
jgi:LDH2 family malate/lactate/ureidoglycolate dehydrogenase